MNRGPANSPISDPAPYQLPVIERQAPPAPVPKSDWAKLGSSRKYKSVDEYIETRKEYWRHFLPGGSALRELAVADPRRAGEWAGIASTIIDELDQLQMRIQVETVK